MYEMRRLSLKEDKFKEMNSEDSNIADYEELTVTDDDFNEDEKLRYGDFLAKRRERKDKGWEDPTRWENRDDPYLALFEEDNNN